MSPGQNYPVLRPFLVNKHPALPRRNFCHWGLLILWLMLFTQASGQTQHWKPGFLRKFWELQVNPLEFREPIRFSPFDIKSGLAIYGGPEMIAGLPLSLLKTDYSVVTLDSTESEVPTIGQFYKRTLLIYDLDFLQINLRGRFLPISVLDVMVGLGIRTQQIPIAPKIPDEWPAGEENYRFAPIFHTGLVSLMLGMQRSDRWYLYLKTSRGIAIGSVYRASAISRTLSGRGPSTDWVLGVKRFGESPIDPRMTLGLELRYHRIDVPELDVPDLPDGRRLSPIQGLNFRAVGVFVTFGAYFGGRSTSADRAKQSLYRGDYISAQEELNSFLQSHPDHTEVGRARELLALARKMAPYQQLDLARQYQEQGDLETALKWYRQAEQGADITLMQDIIAGNEEVGQIYIQRASDALAGNKLDETSDILRIANLLLSDEDVLVERFEAEVLVRRGHQSRQQGNVTLALRNYDAAIRVNPERRVEIEGYKVRLAEDLINQAVRATDRAALALAVESLRQSQLLDPRNEASLDSMLVTLENRMRMLAQGEIQQAIDAQMEAARELRNFVPPTKPRIGMLVAALETALGPADHVTEGFDAAGVSHQIWEYNGGDYPGLYYFENYLLKRIDLAETR
ncbi:MAG: hypothetical protein IID15_00590 [Candidatus Marinimicrobia bacterium]|nr:hypothetical protein [Candidatus Neomarinimicrobiota bacterium]